MEPYWNEQDQSDVERRIGILEESLSAFSPRNLAGIGNAAFRRAAANLRIVLDAGEDLTAGASVCISPGTTTSADTTGQVFSDYQPVRDAAGQRSKVAQSFSFTAESGASSGRSYYVSSIQTEITNSTGSPATYTLSGWIETNSGGLPSGTVVGEVVTVSISIPSATGQGPIFTFQNPVEISAGTTYHMVFAPTGVSDADSCRFSRSGTLSGFSDYFSTTGWQVFPSGGCMRAKANITLSYAGKVYQTDASNNNYLANNFIGLCPGGGREGESVEIYMGPYVNGLSGLTPGTTYYLSDFSGQIATSAGAQSRKVGLAISATEFFIKHDNA